MILRRNYWRARGNERPRRQRNESATDAGIAAITITAATKKGTRSGRKTDQDTIAIIIGITRPDTMIATRTTKRDISTSAPAILRVMETTTNAHTSEGIIGSPVGMRSGKRTRRARSRR
jgi:hypothetical protein